MYYNNYNTLIICTFFNFKTYGTFIQIYKCCENIFRHFHEQYDIHISCGMKKNSFNLGANPHLCFYF